MNSVCISIEANELQQEVLIGQLSEAGAEGFEQTDDHLLAWFHEPSLESYDVNALLKGLSFTVTTVGEKNWNQVWESNFPPVVVDDFCGIRADFHDSIKDVAYEIVITPKMSFGTGHHATTFLMVRQMRNMKLEGKRVFDFGTGTGILAILAEKMGAEGVNAIDVDEWSIENARENIERNHCSRISVSLSSHLPDAQFDAVLANINRNVILQYLDGLKKVLNGGAHLLISGILVADGPAILEAATRHGLSLVSEQERAGWLSQLYLNGQ